MTNMAKERKLRRSQVIQTWGVGAIVPFPNNESLIVGGLEKWNYSDLSENEYKINDERLIKRLRISELRFPPAYISNSAGSKYSNHFIYAYRFPLWHYCPICGHMEKTNPHHKGPVLCDHSSVPEKTKFKPCQMVPERFVVACPEGHLMNFPFLEFVHSGKDPKFYKSHVHSLRRISGGKTASLSGIVYMCTECGAWKDFSGVMQNGSLKNVSFLEGNGGTNCPGSMPWFGNKHENCSHSKTDLRVIQRGGSNVWFADTKSSIYIPPNFNKNTDSKTLQLVEKCWSSLQSMINGKPLYEDENAVNILAAVNKVDPKEFLEALKAKAKASVDTNEEIDEDTYRYQEYVALKTSSGSDNSELYVKNIPINQYDSIISQYFESISLVYKLKETRAFVGFSRLEPSFGKSIEQYRKLITEDGATWLPAIQISGEGIFFLFKKSALEEWKQNNLGIARRANLLSINYNHSYFSRIKGEVSVNPEYVLIHTFSHLLISELSKKCGYGSSSLRERLYISLNHQTDMYGVLIYTSAGDSEGSLGGLVREGAPGRLEDTIISAIQSAEWCSFDPICKNSQGQGPDSCNLAACHNCALLPETCCETGNRLLDRGMLIDIEPNSKNGYFQRIIDDAIKKNS